MTYVPLQISCRVPLTLHHFINEYLWYATVLIHIQKVFIGFSSPPGYWTVWLSYQYFPTPQIPQSPTKVVLARVSFCAVFGRKKVKIHIYHFPTLIISWFIRIHLKNFSSFSFAVFEAKIHCFTLALFKLYLGGGGRGTNIAHRIYFQYL